MQWILRRKHLASCLLFVATIAAVPTTGVVRATEITIDSVLAISSPGRGGRGPVFTDAIEKQLAGGTWRAPVEDETLSLPDGSTRTWKRIDADERGQLTGRELRGGYAHATVTVDRDRVLLLDARGHRHVYVNGSPRGGDVYNLALMRLPVALKAGTNELLFKCGRGSLRATLSEPPASVFFEARDLVVPDLLRGKRRTVALGIPVTSTRLDRVHGVSLHARLGAGPTQSLALPSLPAVSTRRIAVTLDVPARLAGDQATLSLTLRAGGTQLHTTTIDLAVKEPTTRHKRTFISDIDGSVQYFAVTPPAAAAADDAAPGSERRPAMFLSLHGAGVDATNQAYSYGPKADGVVVAPTNRRPFGFDWEDWGRLDAIEVLQIAEREFDTDPRRTYLTGHSMGGHGTWNIGAHFPDRFAAIAPSAGWRDFWSYAGANSFDDPTPVESMLDRAANASRTLLLDRNYLHHGLYILHGDADSNVPVSQARFMRKHLAEYHSNFAYYERPGAGHWWGNQCMDWPPLFDFLRNNQLPEEHTLRRVDFATINPGISSRCYWVSIHQQVRSMERSSISVRLDPGKRAFTITSDNVARFELDLAPLAEPRSRTNRDQEAVDTTVLAAGEPITLEIDGTTLAPTGWPADSPRLSLVRAADGTWDTTDPAPPEEKGPHRAGPFKDAFRNRMIFVYGTRGSDLEKRWARDKARFDAETWQYRGNGSVDVVPDTAFDSSAHPDRGVILYGNADTNLAWGPLLADSPVQVHRGSASIGERTVRGESQAVLFLRPRPGSDVASVAVIAGTGLPGMRLTNQIPYWVSGVGYPDWVVIDTRMLSEGADGVLGGGFFANDWTFSSVDAAWRR